ncbi:L-rhamnose-binding lectin SML-like [Eucyclogobius newberryi]|uniref:L-rhamnose-binding lectin SML-like n=1 Tax=Eucyclogobius newberryi TaxID=166745 RepID=UPI003B59F2B9
MTLFDDITEGFILNCQCNGKKWCELNGNVFTTDPCTETFKYMETSFSCVPAIHRIACEHSMANLHCGAGEVIKVLGADLGRRDHTTCAFRREPARLEKIDCTRHTAVLAQKCDGKNQCTVRASQSVLGTSCMDTSLYLEYAFTCSAAK